MIAGVILEKWKVEIFKRHLTLAGYSYTVEPGFEDIAVLKVSTKSVEALQKVFKAAMLECEKKRFH